MLKLTIRPKDRDGKQLSEAIEVRVQDPHGYMADRTDLPFSRRFRDARINRAVQFAIDTGITSVVALEREIISHTEYQRRVKAGIIKHH